MEERMRWKWMTIAVAAACLALAPAVQAALEDDPVVFTAGPNGPTNNRSPSFEFTAAYPTDCRLFTPTDPNPAYAACASPHQLTNLPDGDYQLVVAPSDTHDPTLSAARSFTVDTVAPAPPVITAPAENAVLGSSFVLQGTVADDVTAVRVSDNDVDRGPAAVLPRGTWQLDVSGLADGTHVLAASATDAAGNPSPVSAPRTVRVDTVAATAEPTPTPLPEVAPAPTPIAMAPPTPTPQADETVVVRPSSGTILVRKPRTTEFVEISRSSGIPLGSEIDARKGRVVLTAEPADGKPFERATFYAGVFVVAQVGGYIELTLSEELAPCKKRKASASAAKPKARKLWGDGKGKFRTKGQYSFATVRGTKWLVEDSCDGTFTRVAQGVVSVRDIPRRKTVLLRAGRSYLAKPKK